MIILIILLLFTYNINDNLPRGIFQNITEHNKIDIIGHHISHPPGKLRELPLIYWRPELQTSSELVASPSIVAAIVALSRLVSAGLYYSRTCTTAILAPQATTPLIPLHQTRTRSPDRTTDLGIQSHVKH